MKDLDNFDTRKKIGSLVKTSFVDYPEHVTAALFLHGCNLRCPYCYNKELITGKTEDYPAVSLEEVFEHLQKRKAVLSGFVISGGEPCIFPALGGLIEKVHSLGYLVKLDTNGTRPEVLEKLFATAATKPDFVAMDLKTIPENYAKFLPANAANNLIGEKIQKSVEIISRLPAKNREFRTVLVPGLTDKNSIEKMAAILPKDAGWRFAIFANGGCLDPAFDNLQPFSAAETAELVEYAKSFIEDSALR